jgi:hypothetical protein
VLAAKNRRLGVPKSQQVQSGMFERREGAACLTIIKQPDQRPNLVTLDPFFYAKLSFCCPTYAWGYCGD